MYVFTFLYPRPKSRSFDYDYHRKVHMSMGVGLTKRFVGVQPKLFWIERIDEDKRDSKEKYAAIVHMVFDNRDDRDKVPDIGHHADALRQLTEDYANYTDTPPEIRMSRWTFDDDISARIDQFNAGTVK